MIARLNKLPPSQCKDALIRLSEKARSCRLSARILARAVVELENKSIEFYNQGVMNEM